MITFLDNKGAEGSTAKGFAKAWDQSLLVHEVWTMAWKLKMHLWIHRVPSEENIADLPSRESCELMKDMRFTWVPPTVAGIFWNVHSCTCGDSDRV